MIHVRVNAIFAPEREAFLRQRGHEVGSAVAHGKCIFSARESTAAGNL
jgi:hypothetical protein